MSRFFILIFLITILFFSCGVETVGVDDVIVDPGIAFVGKKILMIWGEYPPDFEVRYQILIEDFNSKKDTQYFELNDSRETLLGFERDFNFHYFSNEKFPVSITILNRSIFSNSPEVFVQYGRLEKSERFKYIIRSQIFKLKILESLQILYTDDGIIIIT